MYKNSIVTSIFQYKTLLIFGENADVRRDDVVCHMIYVSFLKLVVIFFKLFIKNVSLIYHGFIHFNFIVKFHNLN